jgi:(p)ppGpp synthase/HD superfamily hydrolase
LGEHFDRFTDRELANILVALHLIVNCHGNKPRRTGEPGWEHCLFTASIIRENDLDATAVVCALLHDVLEDCEPSEFEGLKSSIETRFGSKALKITLYLTKSDKNTYMEQLVAGSKKHFEVAFIKVADRIHNVSTVALLTSYRAWQTSYLRETEEKLLPTLEDCTRYIPPEHREKYETLMERLRRDTSEALGLCRTLA